MASIFSVHNWSVAGISYPSPGEDVLGRGLKGSSRAPEPQANTETPVGEELLFILLDSFLL